MTTQTSIVDDRFVAFRVRYELERLGKAQAELAREMDRPRDWLNRRLAGDPVPFTAVELARVAEVLGVEISVFFPPKECP